MAEKKLKQLPLGISAFSEIVQGNYVYVDKTQYIYQMVTGGKYYFLSRPRRFGKSLLISTLEELFTGNKDLFSGLWIANSDYNWKEHPVIRFDFANIAHRTTHDLVLSITSKLEELAQQYTVDISNMLTIEDKFSNLIKKLSQQNKVVILIDEYDKPILDHINKADEAEAQREVLRSLYSVIKGSNQYLRFVMLTGVTKFAKASIFSGLNSLEDITIDSDYATMLGYTNDELITYFTPHINALSKKFKISIENSIQKLCDQYDGYRFSENSQQVYNPFSVMSCLKKKNFDNYWFATGTPDFLVQLIRSQGRDINEVEQPVLDAMHLDKVDIERIPLTALLFQTGYLTIKSFNQQTQKYTLDFPNKEVRNAFIKNLADAFVELSPERTIQYAHDIAVSLKHNDLDSIQKLLQDLFNKMPYTTHIKREHDVQFMLYCIFKIIGIEIDSEVVTSVGRADLVVTIPKHIYVIEIKIDQTAQEALEQIQDRRYYEKYENTGKQITLLGINFDKPTKTVSLESQDVS